MLASHIVRDYLDHFKMDYTKSVFLPEVALHNKEPHKKEELARKMGLEEVP